MPSNTLYDKIWNDHIVVPAGFAPAMLYIDLHLIHEVTSAPAFDTLRRKGISVRRPDRTFGTTDHSIPTTSRQLSDVDSMAARQVRQLVANCAEFKIPLYGMESDRQGIVHVIGPELGLAQPGLTIVCGDSHTSTHGAFGALAFGIGTTEVGHVLATQCLLQRKAKTFEVRVEGKLQEGVTPKDLILAIISQIGTNGGTGYVFEFTGSTFRQMHMEERMTVCNMSIEAGARAGLIAPDDTTFSYVAGRPFAPREEEWDAAVTRWRQLTTDPDATYDERLEFDATTLEPMVSFGTNPAMSLPMSGRIPDPALITDFGAKSELKKALHYMGLSPGQPLVGQPVDVVFLGSCTNSRLSDLRAAANLLRGARVHPSIHMLVVPGSQEVKRQAEAEGLDRIFKEAGAHWREAGCSMCIAMNGDRLEPGQRAISTSNRNFEGRQGRGGRTHLVSPMMAAAAAITGHFTDVRNWEFR